MVSFMIFSIKDPYHLDLVVALLLHTAHTEVSESMSTKSLKKSLTFFSTRSPVATPPKLADLSSTFHPAASRQEIIHLSHPQHPLAQLTFPYIFTCIGCKEYGAGNRYKCITCDIDLHDFCVSAAPWIDNHPLHPQHQLVFYSKPASNGFLRSRCDICAKATRGYVFRCSSCSFEIHPCCSKLSREMELPVHAHTLKLLPLATTLVSGSGGEPGSVCGECNKKRPGRVYGCGVCDYHLHAVCAKAMINGLHAYGIRPPEKPSMLGAAARMASHAIMGFIGGLIEGIGEGVGEVLVENIGRGSPNSRKKN